MSLPKLPQVIKDIIMELKEIIEIPIQNKYMIIDIKLKPENSYTNIIME